MSVEQKYPNGSEEETGHVEEALVDISISDRKGYDEIVSDKGSLIAGEGSGSDTEAYEINVHVLDKTEVMEGRSVTISVELDEGVQLHHN